MADAQDRIQRVPIIVTGNDLSTLFAPLVRDGRMAKFYWQPSRNDLQNILHQMYKVCLHAVPSARGATRAWLRVEKLPNCRFASHHLLIDMRGVMNQGILEGDRSPHQHARCLVVPSCMHANNIDMV